MQSRMLLQMCETVQVPTSAEVREISQFFFPSDFLIRFSIPLRGSESFQDADIRSLFGASSLRVIYVAFQHVVCDGRYVLI